MDLAIHFPTQGRIHLESRFLFSEPRDPECRRFLERVFQAPEITQVTIRSQQGSGEVPRAELGFCPRTHTLKEVVDRVTVLLNPGRVRSRRVRNREAKVVDMASQSNGHAASNGHADGHATKANGGASSNGHLAPGEAIPGSSNAAMQHLGVTITTITPARDGGGEIRYFRHGAIVTHWEIKHELPGRLRLKNPLIHRKRDLCQAIERELTSVLGIDYFKTSPLTSTVLLQYDPRQLTRNQIIEILETAMVNAEHPSQKDKVDLHLPLVHSLGSLGRDGAVRGTGAPARRCGAVCLHVNPNLQGSAHGSC